jgi:hypothetical protein
MIRYAHVAPSRINCDQCQELFGFGKPRYDLILPVLAYSEDKKDNGFVYLKIPWHNQPSLSD